METVNDLPAPAGADAPVPAPDDSPEPVVESEQPASAATGAAASGSGRGRAVRRFVAAFTFGVLGVLAVSAGALAAFESSNSGRIMPGVHVESVDLSGLTSSEARSRLVDAYAGLADGELLLEADGATRTITFESVGRRLDVDAIVERRDGRRTHWGHPRANRLERPKHRPRRRAGAGRGVRGGGPPRRDRGLRSAAGDRAPGCQRRAGRRRLRRDSGPRRPHRRS